ncbi:putative glutamate synthase [Halotydeus destructor]|nr:putative glutamate synthase [Halotydeus destructor]
MVTDDQGPVGDRDGETVEKGSDMYAEMAAKAPLWPGVSFEHEACGVGFLVNLKGVRSHQLLVDARTMSSRMDHRGACSCDDVTGDGAGVLLSVPHQLYAQSVSFELPPEGAYATGLVFLHRLQAESSEKKVRSDFEALALECGLRVLGWRRPPTDNSCLGPVGLASEPLVLQGLLSPRQLWRYYGDLGDEAFVAKVALVHARFSTNTLPSWSRAHPLRMVAHNGEINTLRGNVNWMAAREGSMRSPVFPEAAQLASLYPVVERDVSDSGALDNVLEFLLRAGGDDRSLAEVVMTLVPEAWQHQDGAGMSAERRAFYQWAACSMEPWDGPALLTFTDGRFVGAILDRNGLRPSRYYQTSDGLLVMASEVGVLPRLEPASVVHKGRLRPGRMLLVDSLLGQVVRDDSLKETIAASRPVAAWLRDNLLHLPEQTEEAEPVEAEPADPVELQRFGYTSETLELLLEPMARGGKEALGSMGNDAALAVLSACQPLLYDYFKQLFAQVTNPPIDPFREQLVMSLACPVGPEGNLLAPGPDQCRRLWLPQPILLPGQLRHIRCALFPASRTLEALFAPGIQDSLEQRLDQLCAEARDAVADQGVQCLVLSDASSIGAKEDSRLAVPMLLAVGALHHHLLAHKLRQQVALLVDTGEAREVHHVAVLLGYGADAVCPRLALRLVRAVKDSAAGDSAQGNYVAALGSYKGAQIFEAVGLAAPVVDKCFRGTPSRVGGASFALLQQDVEQRAALDFGGGGGGQLPNRGVFHHRHGGERHVNEPETVALLQQAAQLGSADAYGNWPSATPTPANGLPLDRVEPAKEIVRRFCTGAMSLGSISAEAHSALALAMNSLGGKSNTGEGGESESRFRGPEVAARSAIKQVASGRFGVTAAYLAHADELQIKMAQGAKPGEGGELPGHKVTAEIAQTRHSVAGVGLISPPPHHDIYSIEDLAQLVYDLRCSNPEARISVKLVSCAGVGVVASGVAKARAAHITVSGHDGGTGASSWTGIKGAGLPWELGLAETHQVLVANGLRDRVVLQVDGQLRTAFDILVAAMLGAQEFAMSTAPLIVLGCTMMRKCHLNTCPVGVATQDPELRKKFAGQPEHVVNYLFLLAEELRVEMARLGVASLSQLIGRTDLLRPETDLLVSSRARSLDLAAILAPPPPPKTAREKKEKLVLEIGELGNEDRSFGTTLSFQVARAFGEAGLPAGCAVELRATGHAGQSLGAFLATGLEIQLEGDANDGVAKGLCGGSVVLRPPRQAPFASHENVIAGNVCLYGATAGQLLVAGVAAERFAVRNSGATAVVEGLGDHGCEYMTGGTVLVLGPIGRNFGAGMSGGVAYLLDSQLEPEPAYYSVSRGLEDKQDQETVRQLLELFVAKTESARGRQLLAPFEPQRFSKVMPHEYRRVLEEEKRKASSAASAAPVPTTDLEDVVDGGKAPLDKVRGFVKYRRLDGMYRGVEERRGDWREVYDVPKVRAAAPEQAARCMDCGVPFCSSAPHGCPLNNLVPVWNDLVSREQWAEAARQLLRTNNFPEFTGRVCPAPCEGACVLAINAQPVAIKSIELSIAEHAFESGLLLDEATTGSIAADSGRQVAVVGSGPAGLACAAQLRLAGHAVTVFERQPEAGGLLMYGIPNMKLDKEVVRRRVRLMQAQGVRFRCGVDVRESGDQLLSGFDAVALCLGASWPRDLNIEGRRQLDGIHFAMDFLGSGNLAPGGGAGRAVDAKGKRVVVVGGGDTGCDCIATALRQGATSVVAFEILPEPPGERDAASNPWPQWPKVFRVDYGHQEVRLQTGGRDPRLYCISSTRFVANGDKVAGIETQRVQWTKNGAGWAMSPVEDSRELVPADLVLLAMGFQGPDSYLLDQLGVARDARSNTVVCQAPPPQLQQLDGVPVDAYRALYKEQQQQPEEGGAKQQQAIFACGDCRRGQSLVVWAISEGRQCARQVDAFLTGKPSRLPGPGGLPLAL